MFGFNKDYKFIIPVVLAIILILFFVFRKPDLSDKYSATKAFLDKTDLLSFTLVLKKDKTGSLLIISNNNQEELAEFTYTNDKSNIMFNFKNASPDLIELFPKKQEFTFYKNLKKIVLHHKNEATFIGYHAPYLFDSENILPKKLLNTNIN